MILARLGALLLLVLPGSLRLDVAQAQEPPYDRAALIVVVPDLSFDEMLAIPEAAALARAGGAGLLVNTEEFEVPRVPAVPEGTPPGREHVLVLNADPPTLGARIRDAVTTFPADELLVLLLSRGLDGGARDGDELNAIVVAVGAPSELFDAEGEQGSLTSESTRRSGVVTGADVRATDVAYLGGPTEGLAGNPIEIVDDSPPFALHERYLQQRRLYVPIGTAAALYVTAVGIVGFAFLLLRRRAPTPWRRAAGWAAVSVAMLTTGMLAAGHLPDLTYATAVPMIAIVAVFGTMAFSPLERQDPTLALAGIGVAVLVLFVVEAALGWSGMLTPLVGGSQLDGGRFFGLPNVAIGLLVGSGLWVAQRLRTWQGFALLCALGLFAGLPLVGTNLGGAVTAFAAAGLWLAVRERGRLGVLRGLAAFAGVTVVGTAAILLAHAVSPVETHVSRFEETAGGLGAVLERFADRLEVGVDLIARNPAALVPVLGLPIVLLVVLRPPAAIRASFEGRPAFRDATVVTILAGIVAYVSNDSGPAAAGLAFGLGLGGVLGVSLLARPGKMGAP